MNSPNPPGRLSRGRWLRTAAAGFALALVVAAGAWARIRNFHSVFPPSGEVELLPADSHYYIRFAQLQRRSFPSFTRFDPFVNYPTGAHIYWPPLHTGIVAAAIALAPPDMPERGAAWVDPCIALVELLGVAWLAWKALGPAAALCATVVLGWVPMAVESGALGNADHHVHEPFVLAAICLTLGEALRRRSRGWAIATGFLLGWGRALVPMAFGFVPLAAACFPIGAWVQRRQRPAEQPALGTLCGECGWVCTAVLVLGMLSFGDPSSLEYERWSWFQPLLTLGSFMLGAAICSALSRNSSWRWQAAAALLVGGPVAFQMLRALRHLGGADPILAVVIEAQPLYRDLNWMRSLLGPLLLALPVSWVIAGLALFRRRAIDVLPALLSSIALAAVALGQQARFAQALMGAAAILIAATLHHLEVRSARFAWSAVLILGACTVMPSPSLPPAVAPFVDIAQVRPTLRWIRDHTPAATADPFGPQHPRYAIASSYLLGHLINLWAERPAIASTFAFTQEHTAGNDRAGALLSCDDDQRAFDLARQTGARYVLATPSSVILGFPSFSNQTSILYELLDRGGMGTATRPATAHFRSVFDSVEQRHRPQGGSYARLFEVVPGARLVGVARPGATVEARLSLISTRGDQWTYARSTIADSTGSFEIRVAYSTAASDTGPRVVGSYQLTSAATATSADVPDDAVVEGKVIEVGSVLRDPGSSSQ